MGHVVSFTLNNMQYINISIDELDNYGLEPEYQKQLIKDVIWEPTRLKRDRLVRDTDWTQMPDAPLTTEKKAVFTTYRQALRDIPQTYDNPDDIVWPTKPTI
ncbi:tail fiber assembly protein [Photobacterium iliopiscarium]|uniref:tail fiber assembly protein n=1 Tax=Photobacterium iliopiscarium TaxID=56192 RepID=UPI001E3421B1|nr:tail fiber assembly protein [Photobacterium iliopiscarium]